MQAASLRAQAAKDSLSLQGTGSGSGSGGKDIEGLGKDLQVCILLHLMFVYTLSLTHSLHLMFVYTLSLTLIHYT